MVQDCGDGSKICQASLNSNIERESHLDEYHHAGD
jgi:hypothetical protein